MVETLAKTTARLGQTVKADQVYKKHKQRSQALRSIAASNAASHMMYHHDIHRNL
jgi:predicted kinase